MLWLIGAQWIVDFWFVWWPETWIQIEASIAHASWIADSLLTCSTRQHDMSALSLQLVMLILLLANFCCRLYLNLNFSYFRKPLLMHPPFKCSYIQWDMCRIFSTTTFFQRQWFLTSLVQREAVKCFMHKESLHVYSCPEVLFNFHFFLTPIFSNITALQCIPLPRAILATVWQSVLNKKAKIRFLPPHECSLC